MEMTAEIVNLVKAYNDQREAERQARLVENPKSKSYIKIAGIVFGTVGAPVAVTLKFKECTFGREKESEVNFASDENCVNYLKSFT